MRKVEYELKGFNPAGHCVLRLPFSNLKDMHEEYDYWYDIRENTALVQEYARKYFNINDAIILMECYCFQHNSAGSLIAEFELGQPQGI